MQLNLKTDYSLRLLLFLALHPDETVPVSRVGREFGISTNHLSKVAQALADIHLVELIRGRSGGVRLAVDPASLRVADVVRHVEASLALVECFDAKTNTCVIAPSCGLKHVLREAQHAFFQVLERYSLADLSRNPAALKTLLNQNVDRRGEK